MKYCLPFVFSFLLFIPSRAQDSARHGRVDVVLNITNAISRFTGNGVRNLSEDPYLLAIKYSNKRNTGAIRFGVNQSYSSQSTQIFPGERRTRDFYISPLAGYEFRRHIDKNFMFFFGADVRGSLRQGSVEIIDPGIGPIQLISSQENGYGAGPFCGFVWKINPRINLFTEANFYLNYVSTYRYLDDGVGKTVLEDSHKMIVTPVIPTSIFLSVNF